MLVLATRNAKKLRELQTLLGPHGFDLRTLDDYPDAIDVVEDGETFGDNAALKAVQQALQLKQWVIGEDSGIVVDALGGAPGVYSARFSGEGATDESNNSLLLERLKETPLEKRTAHYVCHITLSDPEGNRRIDCEAYCHGRIRMQPAGSGGFGYDPLFELLEYHQTFGQLGDAVKSVISHRARAMRLLLERLREAGLNQACS